MRNRFYVRSLIAFVFFACQAASSAALSTQTERLTIPVDSAGKAISSSVRADEKRRYELAVTAGDTLSVDLFSQAPDMHFSISPAGSAYPMHASVLDGRVADIVIPKSGDYVVDVFRAPGAEEGVSKAGRAILTMAVYGPDSIQQLSDGPDFWAVTGLRGDALLNLRSGPSTRYEASGKLQNGEPVQNNGCRLTRGKRWCFVRVPSLEITGWVAARFLEPGKAP